MSNPEQHCAQRRGMFPSNWLGANRPAVVLERPEEGQLYLRQVWLHRCFVDLHEKLCQAIACSLPDCMVVGLCTAHIVADNLIQREVETNSQDGAGSGMPHALELPKLPPPVSQAAVGPLTWTPGLQTTLCRKRADNKQTDSNHHACHYMYSLISGLQLRTCWACWATCLGPVSFMTSFQVSRE